VRPTFILKITLVATRQPLQLQFFIALQLQLNMHSSCNTTVSSIATPRALQLQLWTCKFYKFLSDKLQLNEHSSCNMTSTSIATPRALQLQLCTCNFYQTNCNSTTLQLQLDKHLNCNYSKHIDFNSTSTQVATR
jgi:hypothetical protein